MCKMKEFDCAINYREAKGDEGVDCASDDSIEEDLGGH